MPLGAGATADGAVPEVLPLPPGEAPPEDWVPLGSTRSAPEVDPRRDTGGGAAGGAGSGGASWQLRVAPRHRAVVQRFFRAGGAAGEGR